MKSPDIASDIAQKSTTDPEISSASPKPLVSVCVLAYNQERTVRETLEGIVAQKTDFPFEAIVIDDASQDATPEIIAEYAGKYPHIFRPVFLKENYYSQKRSKFVELFFPMCRGEFMAFCEGDDFWTYPRKLQRQADFLRKHPDYSACCHQHKKKDEAGVLSPTYRSTLLLRSRDITAEDIFGDWIVQTATVMIRLNLLLSDHLFLDDLKQRRFKFTDVRIYAAILHLGKVYCFKQQWSVYRLHAKGISFSERQTESTGKTTQRLESLSSLYGGDPSYLPNLSKRAITRIEEISLALHKSKDLLLKFRPFCASWQIIRIGARYPRHTYFRIKANVGTLIFPNRKYK